MRCNDCVGSLLFCDACICSGERFSKSLDIAVAAKAKTLKKFKQLKDTFETDVVERWDQEIQAWTLDPAADDPYKEPEVTRKSTLAYLSGMYAR